MAIGSPNGATRSTYKLSPGTTPLSARHNATSSSEKDATVAFCPSNKSFAVTVDKTSS